MEDPGIEVRTYFARGRNALVARAEFSELYAALCLHVMDNALRLTTETDQLLRDALAAITLHAASRPRNENSAWTVNFQLPLANVFVTADNTLGTVIGNVFTENVRESDRNLFYADTVTDARPPRRSVVEFSGPSFLRAAEVFYNQSEQRLARFFRHSEEDIVLVSAQPDCDEPWVASLTDDAIRTLDQTTELSLLERRRYRFECGCSHDRMLDVLAPTARAQDLFDGDEAIRVHCPRCGRCHVITREAMEARLVGL
jgi:molecular chaperone Hsp33